MSDRSIYEMFERVSTQRPDQPAYRFKQGGGWRAIDWAEARSRVRRIGRALMAIGVEPGDKVTILAQTRLEWVLVDFACVGCGGVTVGIYHSTLAEDCAYIVNHSDATVIVVENDDQLAKVMEVRGELHAIRHIITIDGPDDPAAGVMSWERFLAGADRIDDDAFDARGRAVGPDDLASLVYTSGTTGVPKGVMISHGNLVFVAESSRRSMNVREGYETLLFLPLAHVYARLMIYLCLHTSMVIAFAEDISKVAPNLREVRPHYIASVPRIYEKFHSVITAGARQAGGLKEKLFNWAVGVGRKVSRLQLAKRPVPALLRWRRTLAHRLVLHKVHAAFGGRLEWAISGAAPLNPTIAEFFHACGIPILEGIGMTENTSFSNVNRFDNNKIGTVGEVGPGIEMRIAEDGEVLFRGPNIMQGYYKDPEATAEAIDADGWLHSGDIGEIDQDGFLKITDRKKDLIVTAGGKNVAPQRVERILRTSDYISQVVAVGDKRRFISALITLDAEAIQKWLAANGGGQDAHPASDPRIRELIEREIAERNEQLASFESVKTFRILDRDLSIEGGELTPTLKIRRKVVLDKHAELIEEIYAGA